MYKFILSALVSALLFGQGTFAAAGDAEDLQKVRAQLSTMFPAAVNAEIVSTDAEGVYRLAVNGSYAYAFIQGDFVLIGDLYNTRTTQNIGDVAQAEYLKSQLNSYEDKMIVFGDKDAKHKITVFTDVTCYYCKKLHGEVPDLIKAGVQVRYLLWPRGGLSSDGFNKNLAVWCNDDQQKAMTDAKADRSVAAASCENPIADTFQFGRQAGVSGTPMILFEDGTRQPGYLPSAQLIARLNANAAKGG